MSLSCGGFAHARRLSKVDAAVATCAQSAALAAGAVQQEQLAAGLAQLSTAAARRDHERAQRLAGLALRMEALEGQAARRDQVASQVCIAIGCAC